MWKKIILIIIYLITCIIIYDTFTPLKSTKIKIIFKEKIAIPIKKESPVGYLEIDKLNLHEELYDISSPNNNIEKHVTILPPSKNPEEENTTMFIAAHSGTGKIAYFKNLDKLLKNDQVKLVYKNKSYIYVIKNIWETKKTGTISVTKVNTNQLILTTCSPKRDGYQLIIDAHRTKE